MKRIKPRFFVFVLLFLCLAWINDDLLANIFSKKAPIDSPKKESFVSRLKSFVGIKEVPKEVTGWKKNPKGDPSSGVKDWLKTDDGQAWMREKGKAWADSEAGQKFRITVMEEQKETFFAKEAEAFKGKEAEIDDWKKAPTDTPSPDIEKWLKTEEGRKWRTLTEEGKKWAISSVGRSIITKIETPSLIFRPATLPPIAIPSKLAIPTAPSGEGARGATISEPSTLSRDEAFREEAKTQARVFFREQFSGDTVRQFEEAALFAARSDMPDDQKKFVARLADTVFPRIELMSDEVLKSLPVEQRLILVRLIKNREALSRDDSEYNLRLKNILKRLGTESAVRSELIDKEYAKFSTLSGKKSLSKKEKEDLEGSRKTILANFADSNLKDFSPSQKMQVLKNCYNLVNKDTKKAKAFVSGLEKERKKLEKQITEKSKTQASEDLQKLHALKQKYDSQLENLKSIMESRVYQVAFYEASEAAKKEPVEKAKKEEPTEKIAPPLPRTPAPGIAQIEREAYERDEMARKTVEALAKKKAEEEVVAKEKVEEEVAPAKTTRELSGEVDGFQKELDAAKKELAAAEKSIFGRKAKTDAARKKVAAAEQKLNIAKTEFFEKFLDEEKTYKAKRDEALGKDTSIAKYFRTGARSFNFEDAVSIVAKMTKDQLGALTAQDKLKLFAFCENRRAELDALGRWRLDEDPVVVAAVKKLGDKPQLQIDALSEIKAEYDALLKAPVNEVIGGRGSKVEEQSKSATERYLHFYTMVTQKIKDPEERKKLTQDCRSIVEDNYAAKNYVIQKEQEQADLAKDITQADSELRKTRGTKEYKKKLKEAKKKEAEYSKLRDKLQKLGFKTGTPALPKTIEDLEKRFNEALNEYRRIMVDPVLMREFNEGEKLRTLKEMQSFSKMQTKQVQAILDTKKYNSTLKNIDKEITAKKKLEPLNVKPEVKVEVKPEAEVKPEVIPVSEIVVERKDEPVGPTKPEEAGPTEREGVVTEVDKPKEELDELSAKFEALKRLRGISVPPTQLPSPDDLPSLDELSARFEALKKK
jgi:hypothetical protein